MDLKKILTKIQTKLAGQVFIDQPELEAEVLLSFVIGKPREFLLTNLNYQLNKDERDRLDSLINRRLNGEPIAYILGKKEFYGIEFMVNKSVLNPRPETEILVDLALERIKKSQKTNLNIIDVGTGSGSIAISIAKNLAKNKEVSISATDISTKALATAKKNAQLLGVKINFTKSDLLKDIDNKFDLVIANLPYIRTREAQPIAKLLHHPLLSLDGGATGLELIKKLLNQSKLKLKPNGSIILEIAPEQKNELLKFIKQIFTKPKIKTRKDLSGLDRVVIISP